MSKGKETLYLSYDGILDDLGQSQIIPYLKGITASIQDLHINLISFEKKTRLSASNTKELKQNLRDTHSINWIPLSYHQHPKIASSLVDIAHGNLRSILLRTLKKTSLVHARSYPLATTGLLHKKLFNTPFLFDIRGFWPDEKTDLGQWTKDSGIYKKTKKLEKDFFSSADHIVTLSEKSVPTIRNRYLPEKSLTPVTVIPTSADSQLFRPMEKDQTLLDKLGLKGRTVYTYIGKIETWYLFEEMCNFIRTVSKKVKNSSFLVISSTPEEQYAELLEKASDIRERIVIVPGITHDEVPKYLNLSDFGLFLIKPLPSKIASCATKLGEMLLCGIPVICNRGIGDQEDIVNSNRLGFVLPDFSESSNNGAADFVENSLKDDSLDEIKIRCRETGEKLFSRKLAVESYTEIYRNLLNS